MSDDNKYYISEHGSIHWNADFPLPLAYIAFVNLASPNTKFQPPKYGVSFLIDKGTEEKQLLKNIQEAAKQLPGLLWKDKKEENYKKISNPLFRNGDEKEYEGYEGKYVIVGKNGAGPGKPNGIQILNQGMEPEQFEAGQICRGYVQLGLNKDGFFYKLKAIKFIKDDGTRFAGAPPVEDIDGDVDAAVSAASKNAESFDLGDIG